MRLLLILYMEPFSVKCCFYSVRLQKNEKIVLHSDLLTSHLNWCELQIMMFLSESFLS